MAVNRGYNSNGLNQYSSAGPATFSYDARGNLTSDGSVTYAYDSENKLIAASGTVAGSLSYDPRQRRYQVGSASTNIRFLYEGVNAIAEYDASGARTHSNPLATDDEWRSMSSPNQGGLHALACTTRTRRGFGANAIVVFRAGGGAGI